MPKRLPSLPLLRENENPYGLSIIYQPIDGPPCIDIVLVHGLSGTSQDTWKWKSDPQCFWPSLICEEEPFQRARLLTFGYRARGFKTLSRNSIAEIADFALDLLCHLRDGTQDIPIVFVAHSMGGIVVQEACNLGIDHDDYRDIIQSVFSVFFMATPHSGSALANVYTESMRLAGFRVEPYVKALGLGSEELAKINAKFTNLPRVPQIKSFYETLQTGVWPMLQHVVDRDSSVLNFPGEIKVPMEADHRNIVRFPNVHDPMPRKFINRLARCIVDSGPWKSTAWRLPSKEKAKLLSDWLGVAGAPTEDVSFFSDKMESGTCDWIKSNREIQTLLDNYSSQPTTLWVYGMMGSGKSVLGSYIVKFVKDDLELPCHYFFFREEEPSKRSLASLLRSLAFQMSAHSRQFYEYILGVPSHAECLGSGNAQAIWSEFFAAELPKLEDAFERPIWWIIDGLDTCEAARSLISFLAELSSSSVPLRIIILSRSTEGIIDAMHGLQASELDLDAAAAKRDALQSFVHLNITNSHPLFRSIVTDAQGNFEWARLVMDNLLHCYRDVSVAEASKQAEEAFRMVWKNITSDLVSRLNARDRFIVQGTLTWVAHAKCPPTLRQVCEALGIQVRPFDQRDLKRICNALVMVDEHSCLRLRHRSAREFLTNVESEGLCPDLMTAHKQLFKCCLQAVLNIPAPATNYLPGQDSFAFYAITSWDYHLERCVAHLDSGLFDMMEEFLTGRVVLIWIYYLARIKRFDVMRSSANALAALQLSRYTVTDKHALDALLEPWIEELVMISGKFGDQVLRHPWAIFDVVHPFCPQSSLIRRHLTRSHISFPMIVKTTSNKFWDDTVARLPTSQAASLVVCAADYVAISSTSPEGKVAVFAASNFSDLKTIAHGEVIRLMRFNNTGNILMTYGHTTLKLWQIDTIRLLRTFDAPPAVQLLAMTFQKDGLAVLVCVDDGDIWKFSLLGSGRAGEVFDSVASPDDAENLRSPDSAAFNHDGSQIAVSYGDLPMRVWGVSTTCLFRERQEPEWDRRLERRSYVKKIQWMSNPDNILILRQNGSVWVWDPKLQTARQFLSSGVVDIEGSPSKPFLVTSDDRGNWDIRSEDLSLLYKRSCEENIRCLALCPRGRKVYGLRGNNCDVWEPNILVTLAANDDERHLAALNALLTHENEKNHVAARPNSPIEKLAIASRTFIYCTAHSRGELRISDATGKRLCTFEASYSNTITNVAWSNNENLLAVLDISHNFTVFGLESDQSSWTRVAVTKLATPAHQLLFKSDDSLILAISENSISVWLFREQSRPRTSAVISGSCLWIQHPLEEDFVLRISPKAIDLIGWHSLEQSVHLGRDLSKISYAITNALESTSELVDLRKVINIFKSSDHSCLLVHTATDSNLRDMDFFLISVKNIQLSYPTHRCEIKVQRYPPAVLTMITRPLGFIESAVWEDVTTTRSNVFVFLDKNGWLCTFSNGIVREHFFLPREWLDSDSLDLAQVTTAGTLFVPKDGTIAIIWNGFRHHQVKTSSGVQV